MRKLVCVLSLLLLVLGSSPALAQFDISGTVRDALTNDPIEGVGICVHLSDGSFTGVCATSNVNGEYVATDLPAGSDYVPYAIAEDLGYQRQVYLGEDCPSNLCDFSLGLPVELGNPDNAAAIDFNLIAAQGVSGTISVFDGVDTLPANVEVDISILDPSGNEIIRKPVDASGNWATSVPDGDYLFFAEPVVPGAYQQYVAEMQDGTPCPNRLCTSPNFAGDPAPVSVNAGTGPIDITLERGVIFTGTITDENTASPIDGALAVFSNADSTQQIALAGTTPSGQFETPAYPPQEFTLFSTGFAAGYGREFFDDQKCLRDGEGGCDDAVLARTTVVGNAGDNLVFDSNLVRRVSFSGNVIEAGGGPLEGVPVNVRVAADNFFAASTFTDVNGDWLVENLAPGSYYVTARGEDFGLVGQVYNSGGSNDCPVEICDYAALGTELVNDNGQDRGTLDFALNAQTPAPITGSILDENGEPTPRGAVRFFNAANEHMGDFWVDGAGNFETYPFPDGTYYALTGFTEGVIDDRWDGVDGSPCQNQLCDVLAGAPVTVTGGAVSGRVDFVLDFIPGGGFRISGNVSDSGLNPLEEAGVTLRNSAGEYIGEVRTDRDGNYVSKPLANDDYYLNTNAEELGLARELWSGGEPNYICSPAVACNDPAVVTANGALVGIAGADQPGIDFELDSPDPATAISGQVRDPSLPELAMGEVGVELFDEFGNGWGWRVTDRNGRYFFYGLETDGRTYRVRVNGPPPGYEATVYASAPCPDNGCDPVAVGTPVAVDSTGVDIELPYVGGTRFFGRVSRDDTGAGVPSNAAFMGVRLYDASFSEVATVNTYNSGFYQIILADYGLPAGVDYYLVTDNDQGYHGLINEDNNGTACFTDCNPQAIGTTSEVPSEGESLRVDFSLGAAPRITGQVSDGVNPIAGVQLDLWDVNGNFLTATQTDENGNYAIAAPGDGSFYLFTPVYGIPIPYLPDVWDGVDGSYCDFRVCNILTTGTPIVVSGGVDVANIDFVLETGFTISGNVSASGGGALEGVGVSIHRLDGSWTGAGGGTDASGNYTTTALPPGSDYVAYALPEEQGYQRQVFNGIDCPFNNCDFSAGTAITLGPDATGIDFSVNPAASIAGTVTDSSSGLGIQPQARLHALDGTQLTATNGEVDGTYLLGGIEPGTYYLLLNNRNGPLIDEVYDNVPCPRLSCDFATLGTQITLTAGEARTGVDAALDPGSRISGNVTVDGAPQSFIEMGVYNLDGSFAGFAFTNGAGDYTSRSGFPAGSYYVALLDGQGLSGLVWPNRPCGDPCDVTLGDPVVLDGVNDVGGIDFSATQQFTISGFLTDAVTTDPVSGQIVCIGILNGGVVPGSCRSSDGSGFYQSGPLDSGSDYIPFVLGRDTLYRSETWDGRDCPWNWCDLTTGATLEVGGGVGNQTNIDFQLDGNTVISGQMFDDNGGSPIALDSGGRAYLYATDGTQLATSNTDDSGNWFIGSMLPGSYYLVSAALAAPLVDEVWDNVPCPRLSCDPVAAGATQITVADGDRIGGFDAVLEPGSRIGGNVTVDGAPGAFISLFVYAENGVYAAFAQSDESGAWQTRAALPAGNYYVASRWDGAPDINAEYAPIAWPNAPCGEPCDATLGDLIAVNGIDDVGGIDLALTTAAANTISGNVIGSDTSAALEGITLWLFDLSCNFLAGATTDGSGNYSVQAPGAGDYYLFAIGNDTLFINQQTPYMNQQYPGINVFDSCYPELNDLSLGEAINLTEGAELNGYDFVLEPGGEISGTISDGNGVLPEARGIFRIYRTNGEQQYIGLNKEPDGSYRFGGILPGEYKVVLASDGLGLIDERYDDIACPRNSCDAALGQTFTFTGTESFTGVDAVLAQGAVIRGTLTDAATSDPVPGYCVYFYTETGAYAAVACSDASGNYETSTGLPDGLYRMSNQLENSFNFQPVAGGYVPQVWTSDGSLVFCGDECDFLLGDTILVSGTTAVENIDLAMVQAATLDGRVVDWADGSTPVHPVAIDLIDPATGGIIGIGTVNNPDGNYTISGIPPGDFKILFNAFDSADGYRDELYDEVDCDNGSCDLATLGSVVSLFTGANTLNEDLTLGAAISGTVIADEGGAALNDVKVCVGNQTNTDFEKCAITDGSGFYAVNGLVPLADYVVYTKDVGGQAFYREMYDSQACCDVANGTPVDVTGGNATIDFSLASSGRIAGFVADVTTGAGIGNVPIQLLDESCQRVDVIETFTNDEAFLGNYAISGVPDGIYYVYAVGESQNFVSEIFPDEKRINPCYGGFPAGQAILIENRTQVDGIDFALDPGASISGVISDANGVLPLFRGRPRLYDTDGILISAYLNAEPDNSYRIAGLPPGEYQVLLSSGNLGLIDERYDDVPCPRNACDPALGDLVSVAPFEDVTGIDAVLSPGAVIQGRITDVGSGLGVAGVCVAIYTSAGVYASFGCTDENGNYSTSTGLPDGEYFMSNQFVFADGTSNPVDGGYLPQAWTNDNSFLGCGDPCDVLLGDSFTVSGQAPVTGIDLVMERGTTISGTVRFEGAPVANVAIFLINEQGQSVRNILPVTDAAGFYEIVGVSSGDYYVKTSNRLGYEDRLHNEPVDIPCDPQCNPFAGTLISADGASDVTGIDFDLTLAGTISGVVRNAALDPLPGITLGAANAQGVIVASALSNANGEYTIEGLGARDYFVRSFNQLGFPNALWDGFPCGADCDVVAGTAVPVVAGLDTPNIDLVLEEGSRILGSVLGETDGDPQALQGTVVEIYSAAGALAAAVSVDANGNYVAGGLDAGNYHVVTRTVNPDYIDEAGDGAACPASCDPLSTTLVSLGPQTDLTVDFLLARGATLAVSVKDTLGAWLGPVTLVLVDDQGVEVRRINSQDTEIATPGGNLANAQLRGLAPGDYFLSTENQLGYRNQVFDGIICQGECDPLSGTRISVAGSAEVFRQIVLTQGFSISGNIYDAGTTSLSPATSVSIGVYDSNDKYWGGFPVSPFTGAFTLTGLAPGDYRLYIVGGRIVNNYYGGDSCTPEPCARESGALISIVDSDVTGIVSEIFPSGSITGTALDAEGNFVDRGMAYLYSPSGVFLKSRGVTTYTLTATGEIIGSTFYFDSLASGTYYVALVPDRSRLVETLHESIPCPGGSCDVTTGTPVVLQVPLVGGNQDVEGPAGVTPPRDAVITMQPERGYNIRGSLKDYLNQPLKFTEVYFFNESGAYVADATTDGLGNFVTSSGLPNGTYYAATSRAARPEDTPEEAANAEDGAAPGLQDQAWTGFDCAAICAPSTGSGIGTPIVIDGADESGIDFVLSQAPGIDLEKWTNGVDADTPNGGNAPALTPGAAVTWTYKVTNTGGQTLENVAVVDDKVGAISCPKNTLTPAETMDCTANGTALQLSSGNGVSGNCAGVPNQWLYRNVGTVTAETSGGVVTVDDSDASHYCNAAPQTEVIFQDGFE